MKLASIGVLLCLLLLAACGSGSKITGEVAASGNWLDEFSPEYERYVSLEAKVACDLLEAPPGEEGVSTTMNLQLNALQYGFTDADVVRLQAKYRNDELFKEHTFRRMQEICPEAVGN